MYNRKNNKTTIFFSGNQVQCEPVTSDPTSCPVTLITQKQKMEKRVFVLLEIYVFILEKREKPLRCYRSGPYLSSREQ